MEAVGSVAAIAQILGQVVTIWQQVELARQSVRMGSKLLADISAQLSRLLDTIREVEQQPILQTPAIRAQLDVISHIADELQDVLEEMELLQKRSVLRQSLRALGHRTKDEAKLNDVLTRLEKAKVELGLRIDVVHVGATGKIVQGVQSLVESDQRTRSKVSDCTLIEGNEAEGDSDQRNGIIGLDASHTAQIRENMARGKSRQQNIIASGCTSLSLLEAFD
ncbi:hypothetical protein F5Y05DRAFT_182526 [Hypoxylon sp. FL0543]|nr:hypothetical protein F5Y05DRAFT_182526 [Hypoxylon sp. FL0543]